MYNKYEEVIIGLGSSLWNKKDFLDWACDEMKKIWINFRVSKYIESKPLWWIAEETFLNAVCVFETKYEPFELLSKLQDIENKFWRIREKRWADRTLDLDILYYWKEKINEDNLKIPHIEIKNRDFVMNPILELFPDFKF